jgi:hypothetical protein
MYASGIGNEYGYTANSGKGGKGGKGGKVVRGFQPPNLYFQANPSQTIAASAENTEEHLVEHPPKNGYFELTNNCLIEYSINGDREKVINCYNLSSLPEILIKNNTVRFFSTKIMRGEGMYYDVGKDVMYPSPEIFMNKVLKLMNINQSSSVYLNNEEKKFHECNLEEVEDEEEAEVELASAGGMVLPLKKRLSKEDKAALSPEQKKALKDQKCTAAAIRKASRTLEEQTKIDERVAKMKAARDAKKSAAGGGAERTRKRKIHRSRTRKA